jgi:hypothetical protein
MAHGDEANATGYSMKPLISASFDVLISVVLSWISGINLFKLLLYRKFIYDCT